MHVCFRSRVSMRPQVLISTRARGQCMCVYVFESASASVRTPVYVRVGGVYASNKRVQQLGRQMPNSMDFREKQIDPGARLSVFVPVGT